LSIARRIALSTARHGIRNHPMSNERRKRQQARQQQDQPTKVDSRVIWIAVAVVVVFAVGVYFFSRKKVSPLDGFAKCLTAKQAKMYGLFWCPHCAEQKEMFDSAVQYIPYVECGIEGSHQEESKCMALNIKNFPTWFFADGTRVEGKQSLEFLSQKTGCALP
jgi:glutaredoxin